MNLTQLGSLKTDQKLRNLVANWSISLSWSMCSSERQMSLSCVPGQKDEETIVNQSGGQTVTGTVAAVWNLILCQPPLRSVDVPEAARVLQFLAFQDETVPAAVADKITTGTLSVSSSVPTHLFWRMGRLLKHFLDVLELFQGKRKVSGFWFLLPEFFLLLLVPERKKKLSQSGIIFRPPQMTGLEHISTDGRKK